MAISDVMHSGGIFKWLGVSVLAFVFAVPGCGGDTPSTLYNKAQQHRAGGEIKAAIIELKNVLLQDPNHRAARFALGEIYFSYGDLLSARKELRKALASTAGGELSDRAIVTALAHTNLILDDQSSLEELTAQHSHNDPQQWPELVAISAIAAFRRGELERGQELLSTLTTDSTDTAPFTTLAKAFEAATAAQPKEAYAWLESLPHSFQSPLLLSLKTQLLVLEGRDEEAIGVTETLMSQYPGVLGLRMVKARLLMKTGRLQEAERVLNQLLELAPYHPLTNRLKATVSAELKDFATAQKHAELAIAQNDGDDEARLIAGIAAYEKKEYETALRHLERIAHKLKPSSPANRALIDIKLQLGQTDELPHKLAQLDISQSRDLALLQHATEIMSAEGDADAALSLVKEMSQKAPEKKSLQVLQGQLEMLAGERGGTSHLRRTLQRNPELNSARIRLARQYVSEGRTNDALRLAEDWIASSLNDPHGHILAGLVLASENNPGAATEHYQAALAISPTSLVARIGIADALVQQDDADGAAKMLLDSLRMDPENPSILKRLVQLLFTHRASANFDFNAALDSLRQIRAVVGPEQRSGIITAEATLLVANGAQAEATELLKDAIRNKPSVVQLVLLGDIYASQRNIIKAEDAYSQALRMSPDNIVSRLRLVYLLIADRRIETALTVTFEGLRFAPDNPALLTTAANLQFMNRQLPEARRLLKIGELSALEQLPLYWKVTGLLAMAAKDYSAGIAALEEYRRRVGSPEATMILASALQADGNVNAAIETLRTPARNITMRLQLASLYRAGGDLSAAIAEYDEVLAQQPDHALALNNLAELELGRLRFDRGRKLAEQAYAVAPDHPAVMDTYGQALVATGQAAAAIPILQQAHDAAPDKVSIAIHLAQALIVSGRLDDADLLLSKLDQAQLTESQRQVINDLR